MEKLVILIENATKQSCNQIMVFERIVVLSSLSKWLWTLYLITDWLLMLFFKVQRDKEILKLNGPYMVFRLELFLIYFIPAAFE